MVEMTDLQKRSTDYLAMPYGPKLVHKLFYFAHVCTRAKSRSPMRTRKKYSQHNSHDFTASTVSGLGRSRSALINKLPPKKEHNNKYIFMCRASTRINTHNMPSGTHAHSRTRACIFCNPNGEWVFVVVVVELVERVFASCVRFN